MLVLAINSQSDNFLIELLSQIISLVCYLIRWMDELIYSLKKEGKDRGKRGKDGREEFD